MVMVAIQKPAPIAIRDQASFTFPKNGTGIRLPFPSDLATLTGLTNWPPIWTVPPFTPNMQKAYNASATAILPDITAPPNVQGPPPLSRSLTRQTSFKHLMMDQRRLRPLYWTIWIQSIKRPRSSRLVRKLSATIFSRNVSLHRVTKSPIIPGRIRT